jgi:hypothetical protein
MSAVQRTMKERQRERRLVRWSAYCPLLSMPLPLIGYILSVLACYLALAVWEVARTPPDADDLALFAALMACGAVCVEAARRLGRPTGVSRELLFAWWLPVALLLPPFYALAAPAVLGLLHYLRVRRGPLYRQAFSSAALGLAGAAASVLFRTLSPVPLGGQADSWLTAGSPGWFARPEQAAVAVACAVVFGVLNACLVAVADRLAEPAGRLADMLWDRERMLLDLTQTCVGILVTVACALSTLLLLVALPPVVMLQRGLMHQQLKAAARTDAKTGLLNAAGLVLEAQPGALLRDGSFMTGHVSCFQEVTAASAVRQPPRSARRHRDTSSFRHTAIRQLAPDGNLSPKFARLPSRSPLLRLVDHCPQCIIEDVRVSAPEHH